MIGDTGSLLVVLVVAAAAPLLAAGATRALPRAIVPTAVLELVLGAGVGPHALGAAHLDPTLNILALLGLGFLFFFAGYEIDFAEIRGSPLRLALFGWLISLAIAYSLAGVLAAGGVVISGLLTGSAISTTAVGTILPVLRDTGQLNGTFGRSILAAGGVGELGPVLIVTLLLSTRSNTASQALLLVAFIVVTIAAALASNAAVSRAWGLLNRSMNTSGQLPVRLTVVLVFGLVVLANSLGLDVILGAFAAGLIVRLVLRGRAAEQFASKVDAVGFGFLIPLFFIRSGMNLDLGALGASLGAVLRVPLFLVAFLLVRGLPAVLLYRGELGRRERIALGLLCSTQLPLVVAITELGVAQGQMRQETAVALVSAAVLSVLIFPTLAIWLRSAAVGQPPASASAATGLEPV